MVSASDGIAEVKAFLAELNLSDYLDKLVDEGYDDLRSVRTLTEQDLLEVGFKRGHCKRLLAAVQEEQERHAAQKASAGVAAAAAAASAASSTSSAAAVQAPSAPPAPIVPAWNFDQIIIPPKFAASFSDLCENGLLCWRIVDEITEKGKREERVLAITTHFFFICSLEAEILTSLWVQDIDRLFVQERASHQGNSFVIGVRPQAHAKEPSVIIVLRTDKRNPINDGQHAVAAVQHVHTIATRGAGTLPVMRLDATTDIRRYPELGSLAKPAGYLDPVAKLQKWRATGKWPGVKNGSSPPASGEAAPKSEKKVSFAGEQKLVLCQTAKRLEWWVKGVMEIAQVEEVAYDEAALKVTVSGASRVFSVVLDERKAQHVLHNTRKLCSYTKVPLRGLQKDRPAKPAVAQEVVFTDEDGDSCTFINNDGTMQVWANGKLELPNVTLLTHKDGSLSIGKYELKIVDPPAGPERRGRLTHLAHLCTACSVKAVGLPIAQAGMQPQTEPLSKEEAQEEEIRRLRQELQHLQRQRERRRAGSAKSSDSVSTSGSQLSNGSWRHDPYGGSEPDINSNSFNSTPSSTFSSSAGSRKDVYGHISPHATRSRAMTGSTVESEHAPPTLLSSCSEYPGHEPPNFTPGSSLLSLTLEASSGGGASSEPAHPLQTSPGTQPQPPMHAQPAKTAHVDAAAAAAQQQQQQQQ
eukprot:Rhum_TRINITY_DN10708_c0_g1::Rhum_TRINITY_DN10708_c0_g1_i1::g.39886::m.39886